METTASEARPDGGAGAIMSAAHTYIHVCLTMYAVLRVGESIGKLAMIGDEIVAVVALFFIATSLMAHGSMRAATPERAARLLGIAHATFQIAQLLVFAAVVVLALETYVR